MFRTILFGPYSLIQGILVRELEDGRIAVQVGRNIFVGKPVGAA